MILQQKPSKNPDFFFASRPRRFLNQRKWCHGYCSFFPLPFLGFSCRLTPDGQRLQKCSMTGHHRWDIRKSDNVGNLRESYASSLQAFINGTCYMNHFAVSVGNASGQAFQHQIGTQTTMSTPLYMASASKFPSAIAIMGAVVDGYLSLDDFAHQHLTYWTKEPSDLRSGVRLRHLLGFISGFYSSDAGGDVPCMGQADQDFQKCGQVIYEEAPFAFAPGTVFDYNSFHLQLAGAMACAASGLNISQLLDKYLFQRYGLTDSKYINQTNPGLAAYLQISGRDYEKILSSYLTYEFIPKSLADEMEYDGTDPKKGVAASNSTKSLTDFLGHYGFCHWIECWYNNNDTLTPKCKRENLHSDMGLFGYYPMIDRKNEFYFQIVTAYIVTNLSSFGPTVSSGKLRMLIKPYVDAIMTGSAFPPNNTFSDAGV